MRRWLAPRGLWLVMWSISGCLVSAVWAADPADAIPDSASVVLRVKAPQATLDKLGDFVDAVQPGFGAAVKGNLPALGLAISNPGLTGVDVEKDWWAVVFAESRQKPAMVLVVPTTDADAAQKALPPGFQMRMVDKLSIYSDNEEALGKVHDRAKGKGGALWAKVDASTKKLFDAADLSVLIHLRQLTQAFSSELDQAEPQLNQFLDQIGAAVPDVQRAQMLPIFDVYRLLGKSAVQGVRDSQCLTLGVTFSKDVIRFEDRLQVGEGTQTAKFFASQPTGDLALLGKLPANKSLYFGVKADMSGMIEWSMSMTKAMFGNASAEQKTQFDAAVKEMRDLKWSEMAGYFELDPSSGGAIRAASVAEVTPTKRMRELSHKTLKLMNELELTGFKQTMKLEPAVEKIGGVEVDRITINQEFDPALDPLGIQKKVRNVLFGEEGMVQFAMYQPNRVLQAFGGGLDELQGLLTALNATGSKDAAATAARKRLAEKANVVALIDLAQIFANGVKLAAREKVIPVDASALDGLQLQRSFLGLSVTCESTAAGAQFEIPVSQAQGIAKIVALLVQRFQGQ